MYSYTQCPQSCSMPPLTHTSIGDSWTLPGTSGSVYCRVTAPFSWVLVHKVLFMSSEYFPVLCKFWQLYGGFNGHLLQEGLSHTQVCCTQSPCPCGSPLLTHTPTGDAQTQFCLSLCEVPGSWWTQGLYEPSEHLWWEWGLILNANSSLLPSCWSFSFAFRHGVSPHSRSSASHLTEVSLTMDVGYLLTAGPAKQTTPDLGRGVSPPSHFSWPWMWGISLQGCSSKTQLPLLTLDVQYLLSAAPSPDSCCLPLQHCAAAIFLFSPVFLFLIFPIF